MIDVKNGKISVEFDVESLDDLVVTVLRDNANTLVKNLKEELSAPVTESYRFRNIADYIDQIEALNTVIDYFGGQMVTVDFQR